MSAESTSPLAIVVKAHQAVVLMVNLMARTEPPIMGLLMTPGCRLPAATAA